VSETWRELLTRWSEAGLLDAESVERIRSFELAHAGSNRLRWPVWIALAFGALTLGAGVLLFVSAHWDALSPTARFGLVLLLVAGFHVAAAWTDERFHGLSVTLHAIGTVALGAGIFLAGQIFNLDEHWPGGLMLWAFGAAAAWVLLRSWPQFGLVAVLTPAWLAGEWLVATKPHPPDWFIPGYPRILLSGLVLLALAYFTADRRGPRDTSSRVLNWIGGILLLPLAAGLALLASESTIRVQPISVTLRTIGWTVAIGGPLAISAVLRRTGAWLNALAVLWVLALLQLHRLNGDVLVYVWWALGASGLAAWGVRENRTVRINMGAAIFAVTVVSFYFSHVMDKLGRSASLVGLGLLFLAGGWAIERVRRGLILQAQGAQV
jgi:uncharacterized membrane protein